MTKVKVTGNKPLKGTVHIQGAKNAALPILAASVLFHNETIILDEIPQNTDVRNMVEVLEQIGIDVSADENFQLSVPSKEVFKVQLPEALISKMRATILLLGGLLTAVGEVEIALPGGCSIGYRPIDLHISALEAMGAEIELQHGTIIAKAPNGLQAATIHLDTPSVGATENVILAATLTEGETVIENASREPEVVDLIRFLNQSGAKISGAGTSIIRINGVEKLNGTRYEIIPDRMEAATYMIAAAVTAGEIHLTGVEPSHLETFTAKLREIGVEIDEYQDELIIKGKNEYITDGEIDIRTATFPGFHTDMQVLILPLLLKVKGTSMLLDNIFGQRFRHVEEFVRVGANITQLDNMIIVNQQAPIISGNVVATDVRAAASLVLLGLSQDITLEIDEIDHLYRGYVNLLENLQSLGAEIYVNDENDRKNMNGELNE